MGRTDRNGTLGFPSGDQERKEEEVHEARRVCRRGKTPCLKRVQNREAWSHVKGPGSAAQERSGPRAVS